MFRPIGDVPALVRPIRPAGDAVDKWLGFFLYRLAMGVLVQGRAPQEVIDSDLRRPAFTDPADPATLHFDPSAPLGWDDVEWETDPERTTVTLRTRDGVQRHATLRGRHGIVVSAPESGHRSAGPHIPAPRFPLPPVSAPAGASTRSDRPWPIGDAPDRSGLSDAAARRIGALVEEVTADGCGRAVAVAHRGALVAESYADGFGRESVHNGWSATKSLVGAMMGRLVHEGALRLDQPAPVAEWSAPGDPRAAITIRHLLRMSSGLDCPVGMSPWAEGDRHFSVYGGLPDVYRHLTGLPPLTEPDQRCAYQNSDPLISAKIVADTAERLGVPRHDAPWRLLFDPLGIDSAVLGSDAAGNHILSGLCMATALDWARFGQLYLDDGVWRGRRLLPRGWLEYALTPAPADDEPVYGSALGWLGSELYGGPASGVPAHTWLAAGHYGQRVFVIPSHGLVIVRLGIADNEPLLAETIAGICRAVGPA